MHSAGAFVASCNPGAGDVSARVVGIAADPVDTSPGPGDLRIAGGDTFPASSTSRSAAVMEEI